MWISTQSPPANPPWTGALRCLTHTQPLSTKYWQAARMQLQHSHRYRHLQSLWCTGSVYTWQYAHAVRTHPCHQRQHLCQPGAQGADSTWWGRVRDAARHGCSLAEGNAPGAPPSPGEPFRAVLWCPVAVLSTQGTLCYPDGTDPSTVLQSLACLGWACWERTCALCRAWKQSGSCGRRQAWATRWATKWSRARRALPRSGARWTWGPMWVWARSGQRPRQPRAARAAQSARSAQTAQTAQRAQTWTTPGTTPMMRLQPWRRRGCCMTTTTSRSHLNGPLGRDKG